MCFKRSSSWLCEVRCEVYEFVMIFWKINRLIWNKFGGKMFNEYLFPLCYGLSQLYGYIISISKKIFFLFWEGGGWMKNKWIAGQEYAILVYIFSVLDPLDRIHFGSYSPHLYKNKNGCDLGAFETERTILSVTFCTQVFIEGETSPI